MKDEDRVRAVVLRKGLGRAWPLLLVLAVSATGSGCAVLSWAGPVYGRVSNLSAEECSRSFSAAVAPSLEEQGEAPENAAAAAERTLQQLSAQATHFAATSDSGASDGFLLQEIRRVRACWGSTSGRGRAAPRSRTPSTTSPPAT